MEHPVQRGAAKLVPHSGSFKYLTFTTNRKNSNVRCRFIGRQKLSVFLPFLGMFHLRLPLERDKFSVLAFKKTFFITNYCL